MFPIFDLTAASQSIPIVYPRGELDAPLCRYTGVTRKVPFKLRICSRFLTSLLPYRPFLFSMLPIFDLTAASQSIPIVYVPDFLPHCCLTDCSYFVCSRFLASLLPHRPFLFSMFPIFCPHYCRTTDEYNNNNDNRALYNLLKSTMQCMYIYIYIPTYKSMA